MSGAAVGSADGEPDGAAAPRIDQRRHHGQRRRAGRPCAGSARPGWATGTPTAARGAAGRVRRWPATCARRPTDSNTELARNVLPRVSSLARPRAKYHGVPRCFGGRHVEGHRDEQVVVQVVAHRQVGEYGDAVLAEVRGRADAGEHQDLRGPEHAGGDDDLLAGPDHPAGPVVVDHLDAGGPAARRPRPWRRAPRSGARGWAARGRGGSRARRCSAGRRRRSAGIMLDALLRLRRCSRARTFTPERVGGGLDELERRLRGTGVPGDLDRPAGAAEVVRAVLEVLDPLVDVLTSSAAQPVLPSAAQES